MKRAVLFIIFLVFAGCADISRHPAEATGQQIQHIVFDIDWTIVAEVKDPSRFKDVINVDGTDYVVYPGLRSLIQEIAQHP